VEFGLYLHLPYCRSLCPYCAFSKAPLHRAEPERLLRALEREWTLAAKEAPRAWGTARPRTIYFGGGTPTALDPDSLRGILDWIRRSFDRARVREWTVEANPEGLTSEKLRLLRDAGVDRLSLGIQSLEPAVLKALGRIHTAEGALDSIRGVRDAGFRNVSADLMTAVPGETAEGFEDALATLVRMRIPHVSLYALQVEEGTPFAAKVARGALAPPNEDVAAARYDTAARLLAAAGYRRYEVSSWALSGFESRHNEGYWIRRPYLGLGPGAHSFDGARRWGNEHDVTRYYESIEGGRLPRKDERAVSGVEAGEETVFLGLRRARGLRRGVLDRLDGDTVESWALWAERAGAVRRDPPGRIRPTEHGLMTALEVAAELFARAGRDRAASP
jgi:putative oxygen-independent coproporphyrinogen III oxidase